MNKCRHFLAEQLYKYQFVFQDFVNNATINVDPADYTGDDFHNIPYGARFSVKRGVKVTIFFFNYLFFLFLLTHVVSNEKNGLI